MPKYMILITYDEMNVVTFFESMVEAMNQRFAEYVYDDEAYIEVYQYMINGYKMINFKPRWNVKGEGR